MKCFEPTGAEIIVALKRAIKRGTLKPSYKLDTNRVPYIPGQIYQGTVNLKRK
jgi:hypothetical protein